MENPYEILGISKNSSRKQINSAYKKLSLKVHPDKGGTQFLFNKVNEAYKQLTEPSQCNIQPLNNNFFPTKFHDDHLFDSSLDRFFNKSLFSDEMFDFEHLFSKNMKPTNFYSESVYHSNINGKTKTKRYINKNGNIKEYTK